MSLLNKINCNRIKEGVAFTDDVYFDDGENLFLVKNKAAKPYHVACLTRWNVPYLLSGGHETDTARMATVGHKKDRVEFENVNLGDFGVTNDDEDEYLTSSPAQSSFNSATSTSSDDDIEELEELEELEEV